MGAVALAAAALVTTLVATALEALQPEPEAFDELEASVFEPLQPFLVAAIGGGDGGHHRQTLVLPLKDWASCVRLWGRQTIAGGTTKIQICNWKLYTIINQLVVYFY